MRRAPETPVAGLRAALPEGPLVDTVRSTIDSRALLRPRDTVVVAVSGGADSVALLHVLADLRDEYSVALHVGHLDHRMRADSATDAEFVRRIAAKLNISATVEEVDVPSLAAGQRRSLEDAGRQARYEFLERLAAEIGAGRIATAHTFDDQVETVAMRLLQGAAWEALAGIPGLRPLGRGTVVRPMIRATRAQVLHYLRDRQIAWRDDPTNRDQRFFRNWVRLTWLPVLKAWDSRCQGLLSEVGQRAGDADRLISEAADAVLRQADRGRDTLRFRLDALRPLPPDVQARVIRLALGEVCGTEIALQDVVATRAHECVTGRVGQEVRIDNGVVRRGYRTVEVSLIAPAPSREYHLSVPGHAEASEFGMSISAEVVHRASVPATIPGGRHEVYLDAAAVGRDLIIRAWRRGDKMSPLGLQGTKKVHDIFVDGKTPRWERSRIPLVVDAAGRILWIVGVAIADSAKVTAASSQVVQLQARGLSTMRRIAAAMVPEADQEGRGLHS